MEKLNILGTGFAMATKCYNTCFTISDEQEYFLVDAGGGNTILTNLEKSNIPISKIHNMFISHTHNDHILGSVWIIRAVAQGILNNKYEGNFNIYGHKDVIEAIKTISFLTLQSKFTKMFEERILFHQVTDGYKTNILDREIFKPYEKHHATAKDACKNAKELDVKNVILYHTEDKSLETRKEAYIKEGQEVFNGNIYVPDDLDIISL